MVLGDSRWFLGMILMLLKICLKLYRRRPNALTNYSVPATVGFQRTGKADLFCLQVAGSVASHTSRFLGKVHRCFPHAYTA